MPFASLRTLDLNLRHQLYFFQHAAYLHTLHQLASEDNRFALIVNVPRQLFGVLRCTLERFDELRYHFVERVRFVVEENDFRRFFGENLVVFANLFEWLCGHQVKCGAFRLIFLNKILKSRAVINGK